MSCGRKRASVPPVLHLYSSGDGPASLLPQRPDDRVPGGDDGHHDLRGTRLAVQIGKAFRSYLIFISEIAWCCPAVAAAFSTVARALPATLCQRLAT